VVDLLVEYFLFLQENYHYHLFHHHQIHLDYLVYIHIFVDHLHHHLLMLLLKKLNYHLKRLYFHKFQNLD
jgi:hypothetical protein